jgi:hypothetical protein
MTVEWIVESYRAGRSLLDLHLETRLTVEKIRRVLVAAGVEIRKRGGPKGVRNTAHKFRGPLCRAN